MVQFKWDSNPLFRFLFLFLFLLLNHLKSKRTFYTYIIHNFISFPNSEEIVSFNVSLTLCCMKTEALHHCKLSVANYLPAIFQTYDLSKHSPMAVLRYGVGCLDQMAKSGDECARKTVENLRILVRLITTPMCAFLGRCNVWFHSTSSSLERVTVIDEHH